MWHCGRRNLEKGDLVLIKDSNTVRGEWKRGVVKETHPSEDGRVRRATVSYKCLSAEKEGPQYKGSKFIDVQRPIHNLVVLQAVDK